MTQQSLHDAATPILIVDDSVQFSKVLSRILEGVFGYKNITILHDTGEALGVIAAEPERFKLLFVDYRFPSGMNGAELLSALHQKALIEHKAAFLITSDPSPEGVKLAKSSGAIGIIAKPFDREQLRKQLEIADRTVNCLVDESF